MKPPPPGFLCPSIRKPLKIIGPALPKGFMHLYQTNFIMYRRFPFFQKKENGKLEIYIYSLTLDAPTVLHPVAYLTQFQVVRVRVTSETDSSDLFNRFHGEKSQNCQFHKCALIRWSTRERIR